MAASRPHGVDARAQAAAATRTSRSAHAKAETTWGSNWVPAQASISASAASPERRTACGRTLVIAA